MGGTTEASLLAREFAAQGLSGVLSYAGRVAKPRPQPLPVRIGGFGGVVGLEDYLIRENIGRVIDATHPFAATISRNAVAACERQNIPYCAIERPAWQPTSQDVWHELPDIPAVLQFLDGEARQIFLAIGRQHLAEFAGISQHFYLLRLVDPPQSPLVLPDAEITIDRGPFTVANDLALLRDHRIDLIVAKNSGGVGAQAKLLAARELGLPVVLIARPVMPQRRLCASVDEAMIWLHDHLGV